MIHRLDFATLYRYDSIQGGISIPAIVTAGGVSVECAAKVDTGAEFCLFQRVVAEELSLDLEAGDVKRMTTLAGDFFAYGHEVTLQTFDLSFEVLVYFAADYGVTRNLLGRHGWLQLVQLGLRDYEETLYLSAYDEPEEA